MSDRAGMAGRLATWLGAAVLVSTAYGFGLGWLMQAPTEPGGEDETLPAIMIELAPEPIAVETDDTVVSTAEADAPKVESAETQPKPEPVVEEKPEPKPAEEVETPEPVVEDEPEPEPPVVETKRELPAEPPVEEDDPIVEEVTKVMDSVAAPLPMARPEVREASEKPREKKVERQKPRRKKTAAKPAAEASVKAKAKVRESTRNAAKVASEGKARPADTARWKSRVMVHLGKYKRYPPAARKTRDEGNVQVRFSMDDRGNVLSVSISRSSGSAELDRAAIAMVRNASPVPAPPAGATRTLYAPVHFTIK